MWVEQLSGSESGINELHGTFSTDVWAAGHDALVLHFDGQRWNRVPVPGEIDEWAVLSGVRAIQPGLVYVCETGGAILTGGAVGLASAGRSENHWYGVCVLPKPDHSRVRSGRSQRVPRRLVTTAQEQL
jgi:hypothetical protein